MGHQLSALTAATYHRQLEGKPVHEWELATIEEAGGWKHNFLTVEQYMTTDLFTVTEDEIVDLVANIMDWRRIRHVPVEDSRHRLVGLVSYRSLLRFLARGEASVPDQPVWVREVMEKNLVTIGPETTTQEAIRIMREKRISCLPVLQQGRLVGMVTEGNFLEIARQLLEVSLGEE